MRKVLLTLLLGASAAVCQVPNPPIPLTGSIGSGGVFPLLNSGTVVFSSDANHTMSYPEMSAAVIQVTSTVSLTATRNLIAPQARGFQFVIENSTLGGQSIQVIGASGTGVTVPNGQTFYVVSDGTNYVSAGGGAGGSPFITSLTTNNNNGNSAVSSGVLNVPRYSGVAAPRTSGHCAEFDTNGIDLIDAGAGCGTSSFSLTVNGGSSVAPPVNLQNSTGAGQVDVSNSGSNVQFAVHNTSTAVNGQTCTLGSACTVSAGGTTATYVSAATCMSGVAFATGLAEYDNNAPTLGCYNSASSTAAYLAFAFTPASSQFAEASSGLPAFWTGTGLTILFTSTATSGNVIWEVQTACPALSGSTVGSPTFGTASTVTIAVPGTPGVQAVANISSIAANSVNGCPGASNTTPTQLIYRIFRSAGLGDTANGDARLVAVIRTDSRSQ